MAEGDGVWRRLHPLTPILRSLQVGVPFSIAALIVLARADDAAWILALALAGGLLISLGGILLYYLRFRYRLTGDGIIIMHGVLFRQRRVVPRSRIQNIDLQAGPLQQIFGVVTARIETAGGGGTEADLNFVAREEGRRLRSALMGQRRDGIATLPGQRDGLTEAAPDLGPTPPGGSSTEPIGIPDRASVHPHEPAVVRRSPFRDLVIAGATSNRAGVLFGAIFGGDFLFGFVPTDWLLRRWIPPDLLGPETGLELLIRAADHGLETFLTTLWVTGVLFALTGWALSVLASALQYYGFTLRSANDELQVAYGLLTRREKGFRRLRVQNVQVHESLVRRWFGLATLRVQTAGYGPQTKQEEKVETLTPLARRGEVGDYLRLALPDLHWETVEWKPAHPLARRRLFVRRALPVVIASGVLAALYTPWLLLGLLGLVPAGWFASLHYRHLAHARLGDHILTREGFWNRRTYVVPIRRIQVAHLKATPFQRRLGLVTLVIDTAGSPEPVPEIFSAGQEARAIDLGRDYAIDLMQELGTRVAATGLTF